MAGSADVTLLLQRWKTDKDPAAEAQLFAVVHAELVRIAKRVLRGHADLAHKVDPAELVNEAYLDLRDYPIITANRGPFFELVAKAMRHFLTDLARSGAAQKRPPTRLRVSDTGIRNAVQAAPDMSPLEFYEALDALRAIDERQARAIELRVLGLQNDEIGEQLDISLATVKRDLTTAKAFLALKLNLPSDWIRA